MVGLRYYGGAIGVWIKLFTVT